MNIYITNIHGYPKTSIEQVAQNMVTDIAIQTLGARELGLYAYNMDTDSPEMFRTRMDGILGAITNEDVIILQTPTWNTTHYDKAIITNARRIAPKVNIISFIHDIPPYMMESQRWLIASYNEIYNLSDVVIVPTQRSLDILRDTGMNVSKIVLQHFWDHPVTIDTSYIPAFNKILNYAGNIDRVSFVKQWTNSNIKLAITTTPEKADNNPNLLYMDWYHEDTLLANALRKNGGFGLHWTDSPYWWEYMKINASFKLSLYLAAGIPVVVPFDHPEKEFIVNKKLGLAVHSLDEAISEIESITSEQYSEMTHAVDSFSRSIREGYFTKKALTEAIFKLFYEY